MTQAQLANEIHVTPQAISKWERNIGLPDMENIEALAENFHIFSTDMMQCKITDEKEYTDDTVEMRVLVLRVRWT